MTIPEAIALIEGAIDPRGGMWADLGAGSGVFTRALASLLGPDSRIYAVDRDSRAVATLRRWSSRDAPSVTPVQADFTQSFELPDLGNDLLDGFLLANALHFVRDAEQVLARLVTRLRPGGRVVLVEYDRRAASPWVPYPIPQSRLPSLATAAGLSPFTMTAVRPSAYRGVLYAAFARKR
jgi:ubiquinone/menaquinone biosynthesis C-methylase UbiE